MSEREIERLRDRTHALSNDVAALRWRTEAIETVLKRLDPLVDRLVKADEVADAVSARLHTDREQEMRWWESWWARLGIVALVIDTTFSVLARFH